MIRLICCDVDGTLIGQSGMPPPGIWAAAAEARARGVRVALCSGRPAFGETLDFARQLDDTGWHVFQNGASVLHLATMASRSAPLPPEVVVALVRRARDAGVILELYGDDRYVVESEDARARLHAEVLGVEYVRGSLDAPPHPVVRGQWLLDMASASQELSRPEPGVEFTPSTSPIMPDTLFVSLLPPHVSKLAGVRQIAAAYGVALADVMFVGDGGNDASAMGAVGWPVAMGNAEPGIRAIARHVVGHVDHAGLLEAFELARTIP
ncbi:MAG: HAD hydrolase family protein [Cytophagaceae bacterium]|nr:HAD hydrolase family protein [Gemmatimonadaceae bacterium]